MKPKARVALSILAACSFSCSARELERNEAPVTSAASPARIDQIAQRQAAGAYDPRYHVAAIGSTLAATNPEHGLKLDFSERGVELAPRGERWRLELRATSMTCDAQTIPLTASQPAVRSKLHELEYRREAGGVRVDEWYVNGPLGLEQGFTIETSPCGPNAASVGAVVALAGLTPELDGERVRLRDGEGHVVAHYSDWFGVDATGKALPVALQIEDGGIRLEMNVIGARWPVVLDPMIWVQQHKLVASDGAADDHFSSSLSLSGVTALVGAYFDDDNGESSGSAYVFTRSGATWSEQQKLTADDGAANDTFGLALALSEDTALIGTLDDALGPGSGSAHVFTRSGAAWSPAQKLTASDGTADDWFSSAIAISGTTALVGSPFDDDNGPSSGAAYVFTRSGSVWSEQQKLTASDGAMEDVFGYSLAVDGEIALVGAYNQDGQGTDAGAAYVFTRSGSVWSEQQKLTASDGDGSDYFGQSLSLSGETALLGALLAGTPGASPGAAYVFTRSGTVWSEEQKLTADDGLNIDNFGSAVALSGNTALVGATSHYHQGDGLGSAYLFTRSGTVWTQQQEFVANDGIGGGLFGASLSLSPDWALVGAMRDDDNGAQSGSAYVFHFEPDNGDACSQDSECESLHCVQGVCCDSICDGPCETCLQLEGAAADGLCGFVSEGMDPRNDCDYTYPSTCGTDGSCDGAGSCRLHSAGTECHSGFCVDAETENPRDYCDGAGNCLKTKELACEPGYRCRDGSCWPDCVVDDDCDEEAGFRCVTGGRCKIPRGSPCSAADQCETGQCVDGVCCESECDGECESCAEPGQHGECVPSVPPYPTCEPGYACVDGACRTTCSTDADCDWMNDVMCIAGECRLQNGAPCSDGDSCEDGFCVDGVCCNSACDEPCHTCAVSGVEGRCGPEPTGTMCASTCSDGTEVRSVCDGQGSCEEQPATGCAPYLCGDDACGTECRSDGDCAEGASCVDSECVRSAGPAEEAEADRMSSGCGCRAIGHRSGRASFWALTGLALLLVRRRRLSSPHAPSRTCPATHHAGCRAAFRAGASRWVRSHHRARSIRRRRISPDRRA